MADVADALAWAARGFRVFPLRPLTKLPAIAAFQHAASNDPAQVRAWWADGQDYNVGVLTTDWVVVDVDVKNGKDGLANYALLEGHFDTLTVKTPTGGFHCYYEGPDSGLRVGLRHGVDIRSHNGYVVAPGSYVIDPEKGVEGEYSLYADKPVVWCPLAIERELRAPQEKQARDDTVELDDPRAIDQALVWLANAEPAIEGMGGDNQTYQTAAKLVRDYALSIETAFGLMVSHWNSRCIPPWEPDELWSKIENADEYAAGVAGSARAEAYFDGVEIPTPRAPVRQEGVYFGNAHDANSLRARPWLVEGLLMTGYISIIGGAGAAGKSILSLIIAAHLAAGKSFGPYIVHYPTKVVVYNAEDDLEEQTRRLLAICTSYQMSFVDVRANILLMSSDEFPMMLVSQSHGQPILNEQHVAALVAMCAGPDVGACILDPLVELHGVNENNPIDMRFVMGSLKRIAKEGNVAVLLTHHTTKPSGVVRVRAGDADTLRGSSAIPNAARLVLTLMGATPEDCEKIGIPDHERHRYIRLDDGKMNHSEKKPYGTWFRWNTVALYSGDKVGVLAAVDVKSKEDETRHSMAVLVRQAILDSGTASISLQAAATYLQSTDALYATQPITSLRRTIEKNFKYGIKVEHDTIQVERRAQGGKDMVVVKIV